VFVPGKPFQPRVVKYSSFLGPFPGQQQYAHLNHLKVQGSSPTVIANTVLEAMAVVCRLLALHLLPHINYFLIVIITLISCKIIIFKLLN
jgi:hypothetical protein